MEKPFKWGLIGDLQIPYHDKRAVALFFKVMKWWKPDAIDVVGDIADFLEYSSFSDGTTDEFFNQLKKSKRETVLTAEGEERLETDDEIYKRLNPLPFVKESAVESKKFYTELRKKHPNADIHASLGNHEVRVFKYVDKKMPEYLNEVTPDALWDFNNLGITYEHYEKPPKERFAGIHVHHGATVSSSGMAVRGDIEKYNISLARGHDHNGGVVYKNFPLSNNILIGIGTGHMCDPSQYGLSYTINPAWELGFATVNVVDGRAFPQFINITPEYTCVVDGKIFRG